MSYPWKRVDLPFSRSKPGLMVIAELGIIAPEFFPNEAAPRIYWISNTTSDWVERGGHVHPVGGKRELIVAISGEIEFDLHAAEACGRLRLESPGVGVLIPNGVWHRARLSPSAVLLSIASTLYVVGESALEKPCGCY